MASVTGVITPDVVEYTLTAKKGKTAGESRVFYQSELTIDGEVAVLSLASRSITVLAENNVPISMFSELQAPDGTLDMAKAGTLASQLAPFLPNVAAESAAILFGYYPTDDHGRRSPDYDEVVAFIRSAITIPSWLDILNVFSDQNDWKRMAAPFAGALKKGVTLGLWAEREKNRAPGSAT